ncbi:hypothetical protein [Paracoccus sp. MC1862]|uniref:hypothetical protein n=1 Tax=Paracoccus sp. MC1862 TaxID=2760307 RepID=UPI0015FF5375|nr:hypothetical protein [Paracoccus sp. MC1862]MBB1499052.1 hypothetical protein [Paracoccus sp. MC1862]QQO44686.1 hypothetical protein JGR78_15335 [Paracoccus sp. MC1862]
MDELIWSAQDVGEVLGLIPDDVGGIVINTAEAVYAAPPSQHTMFRTPFFKFFFDERGRPRAYRAISQQAYGDLWNASKYGLWGHILGKSFIRAKADVGRMPLHHKKQERINGFLMRQQAPQLVLRHYDTLSPEMWKEKHLRRIRSEVSVPMAGRFRERQQALIAEAEARDGNAGLDQLYLRMSTLPPGILAECLTEGFVRVIRPEAHLLAQDHS